MRITVNGNVFHLVSQVEPIPKGSPSWTMACRNFMTSTFALGLISIESAGVNRAF